MANRGGGQPGYKRVDPENEDHLGPCMRALTLLQRKFVIALLESPDGNFTEAARVAGYSAENYGSLRVLGHTAANHPKVLLAIEEHARKFIKASTLTSIRHLALVAQDPTHKDQVKAIGMLLNRGGLPEISHQTVDVTVTNKSLDERLAIRMKQLEALGVDLKPLMLEAPKNQPIDTSPGHEEQIEDAEFVAIEPKDEEW